jgi:hypothetical protein
MLGFIEGYRAGRVDLSSSGKIGSHALVLQYLDNFSGLPKGENTNTSDGSAQRD